MMDGKTVWNM